MLLYSSSTSRAGCRFCQAGLIWSLPKFPCNKRLDTRILCSVPNSLRFCVCPMNPCSRNQTLFLSCSNLHLNDTRLSQFEGRVFTNFFRSRLQFNLVRVSQIWANYLFQNSTNSFFGSSKRIQISDFQTKLADKTSCNLVDHPMGTSSWIVPFNQVRLDQCIIPHSSTNFQASSNSRFGP